MNDPIEVEVVEIDGRTPPRPAPAPEPATQSPPPWQAWQGRVRKLDARWWPLWVVLGILAVGLILTVGVVLGAILLVIRLISRLVGGFMGLFAGPVSTTTLRR